MQKNHLEDITVADMIAALIDSNPQLQLDLSCFRNELAMEDELLQSSIEDVLTNYDGELYREAYYGDDIPMITGSSYSKELYEAVNQKYPNEVWFMTGDYQITSFKHEKRERFVLYADEIRKAQFESKGKLVEVEYKCLSNHQTDGIEIMNIVCLNE